MIYKNGKLFHLCTDNTSYVFRVRNDGHLEHLHYGKKISLNGQAEEALSPKHSSLPSATICYSVETPTLSMELMPGEISSTGKGDFGDPFIEVEFADGSRTSDFIFKSCEILNNKPTLPEMPSALPPLQQNNSIKHDSLCGATLLIVLEEASHHNLLLKLFYTVYEKCNIIVKHSELENGTGEALFIHRLLSSQIDFEDSNYEFTTFHGSWTNEMQRSITPCEGKTLLCESRTGFSSNRSNPFVMLSRPGTTEENGYVYGSNLIYSGNHRECTQSGELDRLRFSTGIHPDGFLWLLNPHSSFCSPEAVISFSPDGFGSLSQNYHSFIRAYITRGTWAHKERPVLINSWEACYFDFDEDKVVSIAEDAKRLGIELFVMDDGWFGTRNDAKTSMGDWTCNYDKLPHGIQGLSDRIHSLDMMFGIWVEPEAISRNSNLFREHPDWSLAIPDRDHSEGRNERLLDFTNPEVIDYIYDSLCKVFECNIDYVKWDMNRCISDCFSPYLPANRQGETGHRYILGLYTLLERLVTHFPDILFESCASGGNRADLGMLSYMPQFWASDNTDALCRIQIQTNYSFGYPLGVLGCHVSSVPNHQTLRETSISTRYEVAAFGQLGYELSPAKLTTDDQNDIVEQILHYKEIRKWQYSSSLYRLADGTNGNYCLMEVSDDKSTAMAMTFHEISRPGKPGDILRTRGLANTTMYKMTVRSFKNSIKPVAGRFISFKDDKCSHIRNTVENENYTLQGDLLNESGVRLKSNFNGHNLDENTRFYPDYGTRIYNFYAVSDMS